MSENNNPLSHEHGSNPLMDREVGARLREVVPSYEEILTIIHGIDPRIIIEGEAFITSRRAAQEETAVDMATEVADTVEDSPVVTASPVANVALSASMEDAGLLADDTNHLDPDYPDSIAPDGSAVPSADDISNLGQNDVELAA